MSKEDVQNDTGLLIPEFQTIVSDIMNNIVVYHRLPVAIFETLRTQERQQWLFDNGRSKTLKSNHSTGRAIDLVVFIDGKWSWDSKYDHLYNAMVSLIKYKFNDKVVCGADFPAFKDIYHIEMR